ncbi:MAG: branched-chain amino acid transport system ATP-binding protein [Thermococcaceae archaeon]|nr:branched-chain amino acid transport system ATP-binding protein [Thermococcaceae archaeon]MDK2983644.1 branched-chain amino acid transport system ATP-binding protein [Thermococcaceae archaeon]MDN5319610.1 branched-chain amino acid transport system ATP-binding protein [Thermococcaceae archaeon]
MVLPRTENLSKSFGAVKALDNASITVDEHRLTLIIGPNGSGKSTFLKTLFGLATIYSGKIYYKGEEIINVPSYQKTRLGIVYLPQTNSVFANLTVEENLKRAGYTVPDEEVKDRIDLVLNVFPEIKELFKRKARL